MRIDNSSGSVDQGASRVVLKRLALSSDEYLVHELTTGSDQVPHIRLGVTWQRGGALAPLDPARSVTFNVDQIEAYNAAVKSVAATVRAKTSSAPEPSFAKQVSLAVFHRRRVGR